MLFVAALSFVWFWPTLQLGFRSDDFLTVYYVDRDAGGVRWARVLEEFVRHGLDPTDARERWPGAKGSSTRGPGFARFGDITWTRTMADVRMDDPGEYGEDVAAWALSVLEDSTEVAADGD